MATLLMCLGALGRLAAAAAAPPTNGLHTLEAEGGGTIVYGQMAGPQTLQSALGKALRYLSSRYGARPAVARLLRSADGSALAATFSVEPPSGASREVDGLIIIVVPRTGPAEAALLSDDAARFRTTFKPMLEQLRSQVTLAAKPAVHSDSSGAPPAVAPSGSHGASSSAAHAGSASAPAAPLHQTPFPDGTGSIGLPEGWSIVQAHGGEVGARGPQGESLRFGMPVSLLDPNNPQSRVLGRGPGGSAPGAFVFLPASLDAAGAFKAVIAQLMQKQRKPAPQMNLSTVQESHAGGGWSFFLTGEMDFHDGKGTAATWVQVSVSAPMSLGGRQMTIYQCVVPQALAAAESATVGAIFKSYRTNDAAIMRQIGAEMALTDHIFSNAMGNIERINDASERQTQGMSDFLRGNTVIRDNEWNAHGRASDDLAQALVDSNPNRFEVVPLSEYVKGVDY